MFAHIVLLAKALCAGFEGGLALDWQHAVE